MIEPILKEVVLRDGRIIVVKEADYPDDILQLNLSKAANEANQAEAKAIDDAKQKLPQKTSIFWFYRLITYPRVAACSYMKDGSALPTAEEVFAWPTTERMKWEAASRELNPHWYASIEKVLKDKKEFELTPEQKVELKKKEEKQAS